MYRITWFNKNEYSSNIVLNENFTDGWIRKEEIEKINVSAWEEHCLECAPPECYGNCSKYIKRCDQKCKKTSYGIKRRKDLENTYPSPVQFKFLSWAKIETYKFEPSLLISKIYKINKKWYRIDRLSRRVSNLLKPINKKMSLCGVVEVFKNKKYKKSNGFKPNEVFLFQVFSNYESNYNLFLEFLSNDNVFFRKSFYISKGYNQLIVNCNFFDDHYDNILVRYYPENNLEVEVVVLFSDFVILKTKQDISKNKSDKKVKCVVWDLDNTIWNGILIESNPNDLRVREGVLDVIKKLDERGIIQVVVSKNDEHNVLPILKRLGLYEYFVYIVANWQAKSSNIKNIASTLNINVNSFAFIDDSPFERGEVKTNIPEVRVYDEKIIDRLFELDEFDVIVTEESKMRRKMYQVEAERTSLKESYKGDELKFLKDCDILLTIENVNSTNVERCFELIQRTNQLNLSGNKYSIDEFNKIVNDKSKKSMALSCKDKFGTYGQIGFIMFEIKDDVINIVEYAMSCRVAGKWLEPAILTFFKERFHAKQICFCGKNSSKNERLFKTLMEFGLSEDIKDSNIKLRINSDKIDYPIIVSVEDKFN